MSLLTIFSTLSTRFSLRLVTGYPRASLAASFYIYKVPPTKTREAFLFPSTGSKCDQQQLTPQASGTSKWDLVVVSPETPSACCQPLRSSAGISCLRERTRRVTGCGRERRKQGLRLFESPALTTWLISSGRQENEEDSPQFHPYPLHCTRRFPPCLIYQQSFCSECEAVFLKSNRLPQS